MAAQLRVLRRKIRSVQSIRKITRAMELIATSRITRAQARAEAARPYSAEITRVLSALASAAATLDTPFLVERENPRRAAVLLLTSDRGMCGGYNVNVIRAAEELQALLREQGKIPRLYVVGRKGRRYYQFRERPIVASWTGFTEQPTYQNAIDAGEALVASFLAGADDTDDGAGADGSDDAEGVDELHIVYTEFRNMLTQVPTARRIAPLEVEYVEAEEYGGGDADGQSGPLPSYEFEPDAEILLGNLLPRYLQTRIFAAMLEAAASEQAARRRAMKAATDNATELIGEYTREANQARQAQITQEISEIVGGAEALAAAGSEE